MPKGTYGELLKNWGFQAFLWTQFLGILNDNLYKFVLTFYAKDFANRLIALGQESGQRDYLIPLIGAVFVLPYLFFSGWAGYWADIFNKRRVLIVTKSMEMVSMALAIAAFAYGNMILMFVVLFLMAAQSALFSPAKYGIIPEMLPERDLSRANGLLEMSTFVAIILGSSLAGFLYAYFKSQLWITGVIFLAIAVIGWLCSLGISRVQCSGATHTWQANPWSEIWAGTKIIYRNRVLWLAVMGITYFWFLGALFQMDLVDLGDEVMQISDVQIGLLFTFLAIGIGVGSMAAGWVSGNKIELGLVPFGVAGVGLCSILLYFLTYGYLWTVLGLMLLGLAAGFYSVPLLAYIQHGSGERERGRILATSNFINTIGILLASGALYGCRVWLGLEADGILLLFGIVTLLGTGYALYVTPDLPFRVLFACWVHGFYRLRVWGKENIPKHGPVLLIGNHTSYADGPVIAGTIPRPVRFLIFHAFFQIPIIGGFLRLVGSVPMRHTVGGIRSSLTAARDMLAQGEVVCIFPEGGLSRNGNLMRFQRGIEKVTEGMDVPIVPMHIDGLWGSVLSYAPKKGWKAWLREFRRPVQIVIGEPLPVHTSLFALRQKVQELGAQAFAERPSVQSHLALHFINSAKRRWRCFCMADSSGKALTFGKTLTAAWLVRKWVQKHCVEQDMVGIMLPASVGGALANVGVSLTGKTPVNLNFTIGREAFDASVEQCRIRTIITSRLFLQKAKIEATEDMVFLEDLLKGFSTREKTLTALTTYALPAFMLRYMVCRRPPNPDDLATIIFSSGSTGIPKGAMLSHKNILTNLEAVMQTFNLVEQDCIVGVLPFFHSFGYTCELWLPLVKRFKAVYHPNPADAKVIGQLTQKYTGTILISTSTFCQHYIRKCEAEQFATLRFAVVGAEKLRRTVAEGFRQKFGLELLEGYGCTELSPVVAVNCDDVERGGVKQVGHKPGTVGHPIPGVAVRTVDPDTRRPLGLSEEGLLLVKGPNCMLGYYQMPEKTREVFHEGWYITGDMASIDEDGFIAISDRLSRFSKIGGEMVPHIRIEETINEILGEASSAVTAMPDERKGERLVVLIAKPNANLSDVYKQLQQSHLPNLWLPKLDNIYCVENIPTLASGKADLRRIQQIAQELVERETVS